MAKTPENNILYCEGTSSAIVEWQTPDRDLLVEPLSPSETSLEERYPWTSNPFDIVPIRVTSNETLGLFVETVLIGSGDIVTTVETLAKNKFYSFIATGTITAGVNKFIDACFFVDTTKDTREPSGRLTVDDELFADMFFLAAEKGDVLYDPILHEYSVGYIGNDAPVTFSLAPVGGIDLIQIDIYENTYDLAILNLEGVALFSDTRDKPYLNLNLACGGECPSRTSFACECGGERSCYWDNKNGAISKIFEGTANP